jgi:hypothetical protein
MALVPVAWPGPSAPHDDSCASRTDCGGSGDEQAKAKLCCVEIDEVAIAFDPPT